jgi:GLPGLI family protein
MKNLLVLTAMVMACFVTAQDLYGEATYFSKTNIDQSWMEGNRNLTPDVRKRIEERMKKMGEKTYVLKFNRSESVWIEEKQLAAPSGQGRGFGNFMSSATGGDKYKNISENSFVEQRDMFGKTFLIQDDLPQLEWNITGETRQIGNYTAVKATAVKDNTAVDMGAFRRRRGKKDEEEKKEEESGETKLTDLIEKDDKVEVVAWFTPQIPVQHGPDEYGGLPGLILEVSAGNTTMLCSKVVLNPEDRDEIEPATKGTVTTLEAYNATFAEKMEEMAQRFRGRGRGRN